MNRVAKLAALAVCDDRANGKRAAGARGPAGLFALGALCGAIAGVIAGAALALAAGDPGCAVLRW